MASQRYLVVGAGLAGCLTAWRLQQMGQTVFLIGSTQLPGASEVAGGIINPVTGRWMVKSWNFDTCIKHAIATYHELEKQFNAQLYHALPFIRYCQNDEDVKRIQRRINNPRYKDVLGAYSTEGPHSNLADSTYGFFNIQKAGYVDLKQLLHVLRKHFTGQDLFRDEQFVHSNLTKSNDNWRYHDLTVNHAIFCEGTGARENPWFQQLPFTPIKGETLTVECPTLKLPRTIYHRNKWLLPIESHLFRIGATYNDSSQSQAPSDAGKKELLEATHQLINANYPLTIKEHTAGLRPCTKDFRPFIGSHPNQPGLHIINGLGSKGTLLAPEMIRQFLNHLFENVPLEPEIDCKRYF